MKLNRKTTLLAVALTLASFSATAQTSDSNVQSQTVHYIHKDTDHGLEALRQRTRNAVVYVNDLVTTHIIMPEGVKVIDISSDKIAASQLSDNIVRIKPSGRMLDHELLGTVTIVGERNIVQLDAVIAKGPAKANTVYKVKTGSLIPYNNPDVSMPQSEIARYAWAIHGQPKRFHNIHAKRYGIKAVVNNIYSIGDYFFIDYSLYNNTQIRYSIDEVRVRLVDKKETKATNSQTIELTPVYSLNKSGSFQKAYRNVLVLDRLTFPDEKVLELEVSESQISGRVINIPISYSDILNADGFSQELMKELCKPSLQDNIQQNK